MKHDKRYRELAPGQEEVTGDICHLCRHYFNERNGRRYRGRFNSAIWRLRGTRSADMRRKSQHRRPLHASSRHMIFSGCIMVHLFHFTPASTQPIDGASHLKLSFLHHAAWHHSYHHRSPLVTSHISARAENALYFIKRRFAFTFFYIMKPVTLLVILHQACACALK